MSEVWGTLMWLGVHVLAPVTMARDADGMRVEAWRQVRPAGCGAHRSGAEYAHGPGSSTSTLPSAWVTRPRVCVSWRRPEPLGRMAKIWPPKGFVPTGSQLELNTTVRVIGSRKANPMAHPGRPAKLHPRTEWSPSRKCVSWRRPRPSVSMEKNWQFSDGLVPKGSAEAVKNDHRRVRPVACLLGNVLH